MLRSEYEMSPSVKLARELQCNIPAVVISGGGSRIAYAQGLLMNPTLRQRAEECCVVGGVSAGAMFACALSCCIDDPNSMDRLCAHEFTMIPHWFGVPGIFMDALMRKYVFSHKRMRTFMENSMRKILPDKTKWRLKRDLTVGVCDIRTSKYEEYLFKEGTHIATSLERPGKHETVLDYVVASGSVYGIFQGWQRSATSELVDGGYAHNVPIETIRKASSKSLLISIVPLDASGGVSGNGLWRFMNAANVQFAMAMRADMYRGRAELLCSTRRCVAYSTPCGLLIGPRASTHNNFTFTYSEVAVNTLRVDGQESAKDVVGRPYVSARMAIGKKRRPAVAGDSPVGPVGPAGPAGPAGPLVLLLIIGIWSFVLYAAMARA